MTYNVASHKHSISASWRSHATLVLTRQLYATTLLRVLEPNFTELPRCRVGGMTLWTSLVQHDCRSRISSGWLAARLQLLSLFARQWLATMHQSYVKGGSSSLMARKAFPEP